MVYYYKGKEIGQREDAVKFILALPYNELLNLVYTYLDRFNEEHLKDLIWASVDGDGWTKAGLIGDALLMMEDEWMGMYVMDSMDRGERVDMGYLEYEDWKDDGGRKRIENEGNEGGWF